MVFAIVQHQEPTRVIARVVTLVIIVKIESISVIKIQHIVMQELVKKHNHAV